MRDKKKGNKSRGFGFIFFDDHKAVEAVIKLQQGGSPVTSKCGKTLECKPVDDGKKKAEAAEAEAKRRKVGLESPAHELFVGGTKDLSRDQLTEYFSQFGSVLGKSGDNAPTAHFLIHSFRLALAWSIALVYILMYFLCATSCRVSIGLCRLSHCDGPRDGQGAGLWVRAVRGR